MSGRRENIRSTPNRRRESDVLPGDGVVRRGWYTSLEPAFDHDEHERFVAAALAQQPEIGARLETRLSRLQELMAEAGPVQVVALASLTYLQKDADSYRESEDDRAAAHVEFLALQALPMLGTAGSAPPERLPRLTNEALLLVRQAFADSSELMLLREVEQRRGDGGSAAMLEFRHEALREALVVRGTAFSEHTKLILDGLFAPFQDDCRRLLGFTGAEAWALLHAIPKVIGDRVNPAVAEARRKYSEAKKDLKRLRRKGLLPREVAALAPTAQQTWLRGQLFGEAFHDPISLALITAEALARASGLPESTAASWLELLHCPASEYVDTFHRRPVGGHPITRKPLLKVHSGFLAPVPSAIPETLRPRMEDEMRVRDPDMWARYERHRALWVEETAVERLRAALPGSRSWPRASWVAPDDDSDLDGLVHCDDLGLRLQAKAGRISAAARRGAPSMLKDLSEVVDDAIGQHRRLRSALTRNTSEALGFTSDQAAALAAPLQIEVVVSLDDVTVWATETHKLRQLFIAPETQELPWVLSLADLMAATDLLAGAELAHFLTRRLRLEEEGRIEAHDELDWVGNYISDGLFFDAWFEGPDAPDLIRLQTYTEAIDSWYLSRGGLTSKPIAKPTQPVPSSLDKLIRRMERDRPPHWLTAAVFLLNGDDASRESLATALDHTVSRSTQVGWSNVSQTFGAYGITFWRDRRVAAASFMRTLSSYADQKVGELGIPNWIVIGVGADSRSSVVIRETQPDSRLADVLLRRSRAAESGPVGPTLKGP
jgi:hypothetical protein